MFWIAVVSLFSTWLIPLFFKQPTPINISGDNNQLNQSRHTEFNLLKITYYGQREVEKLKESNKPIGTEIEKATFSITPFSDRPKVIVIPSVTITNWEDGSIVYGEKVNGCVTASFDIKLLNIGGKEARDVKTKWSIIDNDSKITGMDEWLTVYLHKDPFIAKSLVPGTMYSLIYGPHIGASGRGVLKLVLDYEYMDADTGTAYSEQYKGFVNYNTIKNNKGMFYLLSPLREN